jgi:hypothetical protein
MYFPTVGYFSTAILPKNEETVGKFQLAGACFTPRKRFAVISREICRRFHYCSTRIYRVSVGVKKHFISLKAPNDFLPSQKLQGRPVNEVSPEKAAHSSFAAN